MLMRSHLMKFAVAVLTSVVTMQAESRALPEKPDMHAADARSSIVVIGASYAKSWPVKQLAGRPVINRGVGGQETHDLLARFENDVVAERPFAVVIWGFINDIFRSPPEALAARKETIKRNVTEMVTLARRNGIQPVLATEVTMRGKASLKNTVMGWIGRALGKRSYADNINGHVQEINDWIRNYAKQQTIPLLDLQPVLAEADGLRKKEYTMEDGSHLTEAAYGALTRYAEPELPRLLAAASAKAATR